MCKRHLGEVTCLSAGGNRDYLLAEDLDQNKEDMGSVRKPLQHKMSGNDIWRGQDIQEDVWHNEFGKENNKIYYVFGRPGEQQWTT